MNTNEFLRAFFPDENETIYFRAFKPKDAPDTESDRPQNYSASRKQLARAGGEIELRKFNYLRGVYFAPNAGGNSDADITRFNAVFVEKDDLAIEEQHRLLDDCPLAASIRVETKKSVHAYWLLKGNCAADEWRDVQKRLIANFDGDKSIKNPSRVMRLPFFMHLTYNEQATGKYDFKPVELVQFYPERRYSIAELTEAFPAAEKSADESLAGVVVSEIIGNGNRNNELFSLAGGLRRKGLGENEILATLREVNRTRVKPTLPETEIASLAKSVLRYSPEDSIFDRTAKTDIAEEVESLSIPVLSNTALYGLAGEIVRTIEPHTEADNAALLIQLLVGFGCLIGKTAYFRAEADYHYTKLFAVLVGASSKGRKGTSFGQIKRLLCRVDESFIGCVQDGLSSGEGLIFHVRDAQSKKVPIKEKGRIVDYQDEIVDEGATEKRAFIVEPEFARVLRAMAREGSTLSSVIRQAWDSDRLRIMTKNAVRASETQISMVGHITKDELLRNLDETETANGFVNRFMWIFVRRSKYLPEGGNLQDSDLNPLVEKLNKAVMYARITGEMKRDEVARRKWIEIYPKLSDGHTGLLGSVTSRAEAQVMRLACLYALLEQSQVITLEHLTAALALWQYCEDSARYIFGNQTGNKIADTIYAALLGAEEGLTKTQIRDVFQRNTSAGQINSALKLLIELGKLEIIKEQTDGRPREIYRARQHDKNDINDQSIGTSA
ncbi:MAG: primase C-terminal domain-containing protein [Pyrinomonadaceae bacterium]